MIIDIIIYLIQAALIALVLGLITKSSSKPSIPDIQGRHLLKMNKAYDYIGYVSVIMGLIFGFAPYFLDKTEFSLWILMFVVFAMFSILGIVCIKLYKHHYLMFDKYGVEIQNFRKEKVFCKWEEIERGYFNSLSGNVVLNIKNKKEKLRINKHLVGLPSFFQQLGDKTSINVVDLRLN